MNSADRKQLDSIIRSLESLKHQSVELGDELRALARAEWDTNPSALLHRAADSALEGNIGMSLSTLSHLER